MGDRIEHGGGVRVGLDHALEEAIGGAEEAAVGEAEREEGEGVGEGSGGEEGEGPVEEVEEELGVEGAAAE